MRTEAVMQKHQIKRKPDVQKLIKHYMNVNRIKMFFWSIVRFVIVFGLCFIILYPLLVKILGSFMSPDDFVDPTVRFVPRNFSTYYIKKAWDKLEYLKSMGVTVFLSSMVALLQLAVCTMVGYSFARFKFKGRGLLFVLIIITLLIPPQTIMTSLFMNFRYFSILGIFKLNLIDTYWPFVILSATGLGLKNGLYIYIMRQFFRGMPKELEEAAYIDGYGPFMTFLKIMVPNAVPMMITVFVFSFSWQWTDTFYSSLFFSKLMTLSKALMANITFVYTDPVEYSVLRNTSCILIIIPLVVIFAAAQKQLIQGVERSGIVS